MSESADAPAGVRPKWRPSLSLVVFLVLAAVLSLPLVSLYFLKVYQNQLIQQTEAELIAQSAVLAAVLHREIETVIPRDVELGAPVAQPAPSVTFYQPVSARLDLVRDTVLAPRPGARPAASPIDPAFAALGIRLMPDLAAAQKVTLAGFRLLDARGNVIGGRADVGMSLAHVEEVADALQGRFRSVLRARISSHAPPPLYSISRGTDVRVFAAMPVIVRDHVAAVVYASRTPSSVFKQLYERRWTVAVAVFAMVVPMLIIGFVFHRAISAPMYELIARIGEIGAGKRDALRPLKRHGTSDFARLSDSFLDIAGQLRRRSDFISTFATHISHELKSPLTSIQGAAELLRDDVDAPSSSMSRADRQRFLGNIIADADRLTRMSNRLRDLARAENPLGFGATSLSSSVAALRSAFPTLEIAAQGDIEAPMRISAENALIIWSNLADNAVRHGASKFDLLAVLDGNVLRVGATDDGEGISAGNRARIFDSFFTTRRDSGGTGMGLAIVRAILDAHGGAISVLDSERGASFEITLPMAGVVPS